MNELIAGKGQAMMTQVYNRDMHRQVVKHLDIECNTAVVRRSNGREMVLISVSPKLRRGIVHAEKFGALHCQFDPDDIVSVALITDDKRLAPDQSIQEILADLPPDAIERMVRDGYLQTIA